MDMSTGGFRLPIGLSSVPNPTSHFTLSNCSLFAFHLRPAALIVPTRAAAPSNSRISSGVISFRTDSFSLIFCVVRPDRSSTMMWSTRFSSLPYCEVFAEKALFVTRGPVFLFSVIQVAHSTNNLMFFDLFESRRSFSKLNLVNPAWPDWPDRADKDSAPVLSFFFCFGDKREQKMNERGNTVAINVKKCD